MHPTEADDNILFLNKGNWKQVCERVGTPGIIPLLIITLTKMNNFWRTLEFLMLLSRILFGISLDLRILNPVNTKLQITFQHFFCPLSLIYQKELMNWIIRKWEVKLRTVSSLSMFVSLCELIALHSVDGGVPIKLRGRRRTSSAPCRSLIVNLGQLDKLIQNQPQVVQETCGCKVINTCGDRTHWVSRTASTTKWRTN